MLGLVALPPRPRLPTATAVLLCSERARQLIEKHWLAVGYFVPLSPRIEGDGPIRLMARLAFLISQAVLEESFQIL